MQRHGLKGCYDLGMKNPTVLATLLVALLVATAVSGCVSRNVETLSEEEADALGPAPDPVDPSAVAAVPEEAPGIDGSVRVADGTPTPTGVLFVIVRVAGREGGPPLAVRQMTAELPTDFRISEADAMIPGTPFVGELDVIVRLDQDGNAFSQQPGDLQGRAGPVETGATVEIVLEAADPERADASGP